MGYRHILVAIDDSAAGARVLAEAARLADGAALRLVHVLEPERHANGFEAPDTYVREVLPALREAGRQLLERAREDAARHGAHLVDCRVLDPSARRVSDALLEEARAWEADLIVMGTHGRRGLARALMGSDAEQLVRRSPVPVLLVRAADAPILPDPRSAR